jgi:hypothetical protein
LPGRFGADYLLLLVIRPFAPAEARRSSRL